MTRGTVVRCSMPDCGEEAVYKIAAPWSDGRFSELKTYGFACTDHLADVLRSAEARWLDYEPVKDEKDQIKEGLDGSERVIIVGMQRVRPESQVQVKTQDPPKPPPSPLRDLLISRLKAQADEKVNK